MSSHTLRSSNIISQFISEENTSKDQTPIKDDGIEPKKPFCYRIRSSKAFVFSTAAIGVFTSNFVHSILFPLAPFIVARINNGGKETSETEVASSAETGILVAAYAIGLLSGSPVFGWLGDRLTLRRLPMLLGISVSIGANLLFMFSTAYWMLLLARFLQGFSNACIHKDWKEDASMGTYTISLGLQMGKLMGLYASGMVIGLPVGGVLYSELGYQAPFIASLIICAIDFFMRIAIIEKPVFSKTWPLNTPTISEEDGYSNEKPKPNTIRPNFDDAPLMNPVQNAKLSKLLRQPRLLVSLFQMAVVASTMSSFEPTISMWLASEWHFNAAECGLILLAYILPCIVSSVFSGWLCDKIGTKAVAVVSLSFAASTCVCVGIPNHTNSFWTLVPVLAVSGAAIAGCESSVFPEVAKVIATENNNPDDHSGIARCYAMVNVASAIGLCVGPLLAGFLYSAIGFFWLCCLLSIPFVICIPFAYFYVGGSNTKFIVRPPKH
ncbi:major facilitator superfamily domain-containing protein [Phycomyces blakesleeanus]|uniref:Major facilitator superfamily domain-containing protein n=1 Tax=Phycomyces blakesleeanus TaxID=4837 RepID=A0ABR3B8F7_PHYBL